MKKWKVNEVNSRHVAWFSEILGINPIIVRLLLGRGISTIKEAEDFLMPDISNLGNPFLLPDMEKAVGRIRMAVSKKEGILIFGDRDVDGITSIAIVYRMLKILFPSRAENIFWYIPSTEGYGLSKEIIEKYKKESAISLMITVDCGISNFDEVEFAKSLGIDVIVTDHHEPPDRIPNAFAVINPKLASSNYPFRELAGCAVALKTLHALLFSYNPHYNEELVALDIETTGLHPKHSEICELGAVLTKNAKIIGQYQTLVKTRRPISSSATAIHGITDGMCAHAPSIKEALGGLLEFVGDRKLIIHNAPFDLGFLRHAFRDELGLRFENDHIDTLQISRQHFPFKSHSLTSLVNDMKIDVSEHHRALSDAIACANIFWRLQEMSDVRMRHFLEENLDLVSIGTLADIMPMVSENRILVKKGIDVLKRTKKIGVKMLIDGASSNKKKISFNSRYITWSITPVLNAAGRMGQADVACKLLLASRTDEAAELYDILCKLNMDRKELQELNIEKFGELLPKQCDVENDKIFVILADDVEHGVTGIVASNIVRRYRKPAILLVAKDGVAQGAGRSHNGIDLLGIIEKTSDLLVKYGGHKNAVGLSLKVENVDEFKKRVKALSLKLPEIAPTELLIDAVLKHSDIKVELIKQLEIMEPFGLENQPPVFLIEGMSVASQSQVGSDKSHLRLKLAKNGKNIDAVGWGMGELTDTIMKWKQVDVAAHLETNYWKDKESIQLQILGIRESVLAAAVWK